MCDIVYKSWTVTAFSISNNRCKSGTGHNIFIRILLATPVRFGRVQRLPWRAFDLFLVVQTLSASAQHDKEQNKWVICLSCRARLGGAPL